LFAAALNYLDRQLLAAVAPLVKAEFHLTNQDYGVVLLAFSLTYAFSSPFIGLFIDRVGLTIGISSAVSAWSLVGAVTAFVHGFPGLLAMRAFLGVAESAIMPGSGKVTGSYLRPREYAIGSALNQIGLSIGGVMAPLVVGLLAVRYGWRSVFLLCGTFGFIWDARIAEREIHSGKWRGPLHGIPIALKDLFDTAGVRTTAASAVFLNRVPERDAEVVRRLKKAGAVILGKLNMDEFAYSFTSETSHFGPVHNPWKLNHTPGGSSSGSAAAVAAKMCFAALGSDTGGSIREPASFCGVAGLKPTYGRVSTAGVIPLSWTLDHIGPLCRTVRDTSIVYATIAGFDEGDPESLAESQSSGRRIGNNISSWRLGMPQAPFLEQLDPDIDSIWKEAVRVLVRLTSGVRDDVKVPVIADSPVLPVEAYAYHEANLSKTPELYNPRIRANLMRGAPISASAYARGRREIAELRTRSSKMFESVELIITPTTPRLAGALDPDGKPDPLFLRNTRPFNLNGLPAISVPCGFSRGGLPVGLQITGPHLAESRVFALAQAFESATQWHKRSPGDHPLDKASIY
jgi:aspartyl-tRNA(Asn)/glutamyl-tRNA(Gln) amidotransferase subunit A